MIYGNKFYGYGTTDNPIDLFEIITADTKNIEYIYKGFEEGFDINVQESSNFRNISNKIFVFIKDFFNKILDGIEKTIIFINTKINSLIQKILDYIDKNKELLSEDADLLNEAQNDKTVKVITISTNAYGYIEQYKTSIYQLGALIISYEKDISKVIDLDNPSVKDMDKFNNSFLKDWDKNEKECKEAIDFITSAKYGDIFVTKEFDLRKKRDIKTIKDCIISNSVFFEKIKKEYTELKLHISSIEKEYYKPIEEAYNGLNNIVLDSKNFDDVKNKFGYTEEQIKAANKLAQNLYTNIKKYVTVNTKGISSITGIFNDAIKNNKELLIYIASSIGVLVGAPKDYK